MVSFPQSSVAVHVRSIVDPHTKVIIFSVNTILTEVSQLSLAVTPPIPIIGAVGIASHSTVVFDGTPDIVGSVVSSTVIVCVCMVSFPQSSVAVHVRSIVEPHTKVIMFSVNTIVTFVSQLSLAVTPPIPMIGAVGIASHSTVVFDGTPDIVGSVVSSTVIVCVCMVSFPQSSVAVHVRSIVDPHTKVIIFSVNTIRNRFVSQLSLAVTPPIPIIGAVGIASHSTVVFDGTPDIVGSVVSSTVIVCVCMVSFPQSSVAVHVRSIVDPHTKVIMFSVNTIVTFVSQLSLAVTPPIPIIGAVGIASHSTVVFDGTPDIVGSVVSSTVIVCVCMVSFPQSSVAVHVRSIVDPHTKVIIFSVNTILTEVSQLSLAVTPPIPIIGAVGIASHSTVVFDGTPDIVGSVVSSTVII